LSLGLAAWRIRIIAKRVVDPISALSASAEALGQGQPIYPVQSNIQEIQNLDQALQRASESLSTEGHLQRQLEHSQRMETVGTLAGGIAHDVNNQLAAILGQLNLCRELLSESHPIQGRLQKAEEATLRCAQTTKALLSFSHKSKPELKWLDINLLVRDTATILERLLGGRIRLNLGLAPNLPAVLGDPVQLEQVLMNLSVNARDAMPEGGTLSLRTLETAGGMVCLEVADSGTGIPEAILPHIFEPFVTTKEIGKGTGLGLAMVFAILKAHRGKIVAENHPEGGACFRILLPVSETPSNPLLGKRAKIQTHPELLVGKKVLLAEDEILLRDMLADALTLARVQVTSAPDGAVAWQAWQARAFDLVVSDHRMPDCTGLELLNLIRSTGSQVPFLMISGQGLESMEETLAGDPYLRLLPKPFEIPRLLAAMEEALTSA
jgi:signal transduction histidine kinase/CheY-like chemotaxis protein